MNTIATAEENLRRAQKRSKNTLDDILQQKGDHMMDLISKSPKIVEDPRTVTSASEPQKPDDSVSLHPQQNEQVMETPRATKTVISTASVLPRTYPDTALDTVINNRGRGRGRGGRGRGHSRGNFRGRGRGAER